MANSATLSITKQYSITLGTDEYKLDAGSTVTAVANVTKRQVTVPTASEKDILSVDTTGIAPGTLTDLTALIVVNIDTTNTCRLRVADTGGFTFDVKLQPGQSFDLYNTKLSVHATEGAFSAYSDINTVSAQFDTADGELIVFAGE